MEEELRSKAQATLSLEAMRSLEEMLQAKLSEQASACLANLLHVPIKKTTDATDMHKAAAVKALGAAVYLPSAGPQPLARVDR